MEYYQMTLDDWISMKESLKKDLIGVSESFVRIGFKLRQIEEEKLYEKDGYKTIAEFAKAEYGLTASTVSRFIAINKKYSLNGYSEELRPEYAALGSSKLSEMLALPDSDMEMIRPETTRESIRDLKQFNKQEAPAEGVDLGMYDMIEQFYEDNHDLLVRMYTEGAIEDPKAAAELINPGGNRTYRKGLWFMSMFDSEIKFKKFGGVPETMTWREFTDITDHLYSQAYMNGELDPKEEDESEDGERDGGRSQEEENSERESESGDSIPAGGTGEARSMGPAGSGDENNTDTGTVSGTPGEELAGNRGMDSGALEGVENERESVLDGLGDGDISSDSETGADGDDKSRGEAAGDREGNSDSERGAGVPVRDESLGERNDEDGSNIERNSGGNAPGGEKTGDGAESEEQSREAEEVREEETERPAGSETPAVSFMNVPEEVAEAADEELEFDKPFGSRKDYLDSLTEYGAAEYLYKQYMGGKFNLKMLNSIRMMEQWLKVTVDQKGREY